MYSTLSPTALLIAVCAFTVAVFAGTFAGDFQYDDFSTILENPHVDGWKTFAGHLGHMVRPVLYATFMLDQSLYGRSPAGYHLLNLLLHLGSGCLLYRLLTRAVPDKTSLIPLWTACVFLIHPITTETVTYISGRASGLMAFLYLLALLLYVKASEQSDGLSRLYLTAAVVSFVFSIGSKETAVMFPIILLLWETLINHQQGPKRLGTVVSCHAPFWAVVLLAAGWASTHPRYADLAQFSFTIRPFWDNVLSGLHVMALAAFLLVFPWRQNFDHDLPEFHSLSQWPLPLDLLLLVGSLAASLLGRRRFPLAAFGLCWFFVHLLPTTLIPRNDLLSERNLYLPSIGLFLATVALGSHFTRWLNTNLRRPRLCRIGSIGAATCVAFTLCFFTDQRNSLYHDQISLWSDAVLKSPTKARPHNNLGRAYALEGDWDRAIEEFRTAVRLEPDYVLAQQNLRHAYLHRVGRQ